MMLVRISKYFSRKETKSLAFLFDEPSPSDNTPNALDVLMVLKKRNLFSHDNIYPLTDILMHFGHGGVSTDEVAKYKEWAEQAGVKFVTNSSYAGVS